MPAPRRPEAVELVLATIAVSGVLLLAGLIALLSQSAARPTGMNRVRMTAQLDVLRPGQTACQRKELVPGGTGAVRVSLLPPAGGGGGVRVSALADGATVASGTLAPGWREATPTVPLRPVVERDTPARICIAATGGPLVGLAGEETEGASRATVDGRALSGDVRFVYLPPRPATWWSSLGTVVGRMDAGHPLGATAIALLVALLLLVSAGLASWQLARGDR